MTNSQVYDEIKETCIQFVNDMFLFFCFYWRRENIFYAFFM